MTLKHGPEGRILLQVADTGRGIPAGVDLRQTESLGMQLVFTLVEQLEGSIDFTTAKDEGTRFELSFPANQSRTPSAHAIETHA